MSRSPNRLAAVIVGALYLVIGALGFFPTQGDTMLGVFAVNGFQNVVHLVIGAALLMAGLSNPRAAKTVNTVSGTVYLVLGIFGLFVAGTDLDLLALNTPDQVLHFASAVVLLGVGLGADQPRAAVT